MGFCGGTLLMPEFSLKEYGEFTTLMQCTIAGIQKEDIEIKYLRDVKIKGENQEFVLEISGSSNNPRVLNNSTSFNIQLPIDTNEYYGYDYFLDYGILTLILHKTQKKDIGLFNSEPKIKYKREPILFV